MKREMYQLMWMINECQRVAISLTKNAAFSDSCANIVEPHVKELHSDAAHLWHKLQKLVEMQSDAYDQENGV